MNLIATAPQWGFYLFVAILIASAIQDGWQLKISNYLVGALLLGGIVMAVMAGPEIALWKNLAMLAAIMVVGTFMFARGMIGGGDVKLLAASAFWFNAESGLHMLVAVALTGGVLTILVLGVRILFGGGIGFLRRGAGVPYGIAIAIGSIIAAVGLR